MRVCFLLVAAVLLVAVTSSASADPKFYIVYKKDYLDKHPDKKYAEEVHKADVRCLVCHQGKKSKKNHNIVGTELDKLLDRKKDLNNVEKISGALKQVLAMHVDPKNDKSETYLDRIKASKWPAGEIEELKKEPKEEAAK